LEHLPPDMTAHDLAIHRALVAGWVPDSAEETSRTQLERRVGRALSEQDLDRLTAMSVLVRTGDPGVFRVDPGLLHLGAQLLDVPVSLDAILAARAVMLEHTRSAARELSRLFREEVWDRPDGSEPAPDRLARTKTLSAHMQPLVLQALVTAFQRSMKEELRTWLTEEE
ncbi:transcriptional regulator, partial [Streptomyces pathocidini]